MLDSPCQQRNQQWLTPEKPLVLVILVILCLIAFKPEWNRADDEGRDLWWRVGWDQALLGGVAQWALVRLVERERLDLLVLPWRVARAGQVAAAAVLGAPAASTAHRGVAELGDGARWHSSGVWRKTERNKCQYEVFMIKEKKSLVLLLGWNIHFTPILLPCWSRPSRPSFRIWWKTDATLASVSVDSLTPSFTL